MRTPPGVRSTGHVAPTSRRCRATGAGRGAALALPEAQRQAAGTPSVAVHPRAACGRSASLTERSATAGHAQVARLRHAWCAMPVPVPVNAARQTQRADPCRLLLCAQHSVKQPPCAPPQRKATYPRQLQRFLPAPQRGTTSEERATTHTHSGGARLPLMIGVAVTRVVHVAQRPGCKAYPAPTCARHSRRLSTSTHTQ